MINSNSKNSKILDSTSGKIMNAVFNAVDTDKQGDCNAMVRSVSALSDYYEYDTESKTQNSTPKGVPIKNFDSLIEHMASLNVKFLN